MAYSHVLETALEAGKITFGIWLLLAIARPLIANSFGHYGLWRASWDAFFPRLPWDVLLWKPYVAVKEWWEENFSFGKGETGGFASWLTVISTRYAKGDKLLGRARLPFGIPSHMAVGEKSDKHSLATGSTRSGKSQFLQAELALHYGPSFTVDVFGEFSREILPAKEEQGFKFLPIDPFGLLDRPSASMNLMAQITALNEAMGQDLTTMLCNRLSAALFPENGNEKPFFVLTPRSLWARVSAFAMCIFDNPSPIDVRRLVNFGFIDEAGGDAVLGLQYLWQAMADCPLYDGYIAAAGVEMLDADPKTQKNILSTVRSRTEFFDHAQVRNVSVRNDGNLIDLKKNGSKLAISLVAPVDELRTTLKPFFALWNTMLITTFQYIPGNISPRCKYTCDELQAFGGDISGLAEAFPTLGGRGLDITAATQDLSGLANAMQDWATLIGNSSHVFFFANEDPKTLQYIENNVLGKKTRKRKRKGQVYTEDRPVMTTDQLSRFLSSKRNNVIVKRAGGRPFRLKRFMAYKHLPVWLNRPNAAHGESNGRTQGRSIYARIQDLLGRTQPAKKVHRIDYDRSKVIALEMARKARDNSRRAA